MQSTFRALRPVSKATLGLLLMGGLLGLPWGLLGCDGGSPQPNASVQPTAAAPQAVPAAPQPGLAAPAAPTQEVAAESVDEMPPIRLEPEVIDFGIVPPSVSKEGVVKLVNAGTKEL